MRFIEQRGFKTFEFTVLILMGALTVVSFPGCGDRADDSNSTPQGVEITFNAVVGDEPFQCGKTYRDIGSDGLELSFTDFRMYVHDFKLIDERGETHPLVLAADNIWQSQGVALIDFEDGCENGTKELNTSVIGTATIRKIIGIEFAIGVPNEMNSNKTILESRGSPLNQSSMFWSWKSGYKFVRLDSDVNSFRFHLGSTECTEDFKCKHENIPSIRMDQFDPETQVIALDLRALLAESAVGTNTTGTAPGCMGEPTDPDCTAIFEFLGVGVGRKPGAIKVLSKDAMNQAASGGNGP